MNRDNLPETANQQDAGLVRRGLLLLGLMTALAVVVVMIIVQRPTPPDFSTGEATPFVLPVAAPVGFPGALPWAGIAVLGDHLPSEPGWEIRYNAALALARRGSPHTPWITIREMLDVERQRRNFPGKLSAGKIRSDDESALRTVHATLGVVADWHKKQGDAAKVAIASELELVYAEVDRLAESDNTQIRVLADRTRQTFFRK